MKEIKFNELIVKVVTYEGMYYTIGKHTKDEILDYKREWERETTESISYDEILNEIINQDLISVIINPQERLGCVTVTDEGLIYLPYENKLLNRKEIKESLIQYN